MRMFFNDRNVFFQADPAQYPRGFKYATAATGDDGNLNRTADPNNLATFGDPLEPATNPNVTLKVRVTEDLAPGRFPEGGNSPDPDTRLQPTATEPVVSFRLLDVDAACRGGQIFGREGEPGTDGGDVAVPGIVRFR